MGYNGQMDDTQYIKTVMEYLILTFECQVYYHVGDHPSRNNLPKMMRHLIQCILDPKCDLQNLLEYYPRLNDAFQKSLSACACELHLFSSTKNQIRRVLNAHHEDYFDVVLHEISFTVSIYWESAYTKGRSLAQTIFQA